MKTIDELRAIVNELEKKTQVLGYLASLPHPYNPADRWMLKNTNTAVDNILKLLRREINEDAIMATEFRHKALRLRNVEMNTDAILSFVLLHQIELLANEQVEKINAYLPLCEKHL